MKKIEKSIKKYKYVLIVIIAILVIVFGLVFINFITDHKDSILILISILSSILLPIIILLISNDFTKGLKNREKILDAVLNKQSSEILTKRKIEAIDAMWTGIRKIDSDIAAIRNLTSAFFPEEYKKVVEDGFKLKDKNTISRESKNTKDLVSPHIPLLGYEIRKWFEIYRVISYRSAYFYINNFDKKMFVVNWYEDQETMLKSYLGKKLYNYVKQSPLGSIERFNQIILNYIYDKVEKYLNGNVGIYDAQKLNSIINQLEKGKIDESLDSEMYIKKDCINNGLNLDVCTLSYSIPAFEKNNEAL